MSCLRRHMILSSNPYIDPFNRVAAKHPAAIVVVGLILGISLIAVGSFWLLDTNGEPASEVAYVQPHITENEDSPALSPLQERQLLREILENAISAQGGRIFVDRMLSMKKVGALTQDEMTFEAIYAFKRPNRVRYRLAKDDRGSRFGYDGSRAWLQTFNAGRLSPAQPLGEDGTAGLIVTSELAIPAVLFFEETQYMSFLGTYKVEGHRCYILKYTGPLRASQRFYIDQDSFLLRQRSRQARLRGEDPTLVEVIFSDFRTIDGIDFPFRETVLFDGEIQTVFEIEKHLINPGILDEYFEMPGES